MISIDVVSETNLWNKRIKKKNFFFSSIVSNFPKEYRFMKKKAYLTILLSNDSNIKKLNNKFRKKNKPTDILSFPCEKQFNIKKNSYLGDIVISYQSINKPKSLSNLDFKKKTAKIFIHGFLHLLGYDHVKLKNFTKMIKVEKKIYGIIDKKIKIFS